MKDNKEVNYNNKIRQSKELTKFRYHLELPEQKMLLCFFGQIKQNEDAFTEEEISLDDIVKYCGFDDKNVYRTVKRAAKTLSKEIVEYTNGKDYSYVPWFRFIRYQNGYISYQLNDAISSEILKLYENHKIYISIDPRLVPAFKNNYGLRLYLILKGDLASHRTNSSYSLEEICYMLKLPKAYDPQKNNNAAAHQHAKIIQPAIEEINNVSDINVKCDAIKRSRKIVGWKFTLSTNVKTLTNETQAQSQIQGNPAQVKAIPQNTKWYTQKDADVDSAIADLISHGVDKNSIIPLLNNFETKEDFLIAKASGMHNFSEAKKGKTHIDNDGKWIYRAIERYNAGMHTLFDEIEAKPAFSNSHLSNELYNKIETATDWSDIIRLAKSQIDINTAVYILTTARNIKANLLTAYQRRYRIMEDEQARKYPGEGTYQPIGYDVDFQIAMINIHGIVMLEEPIEDIIKANEK